MSLIRSTQVHCSLTILVVTTEWPRHDGDIAGIHVINQIRRLEHAGLQADVFSFRGCKNPVNYWRASRKFNRLNLSQYDIIHAHHGQSGLVALSQRQRPVVVTFHGSDLQGIRDVRGRVTLAGYILRHVSRWVAARANAVILVSDSLARQLPRSVDYQVIPAGIDTGLFRPLPMSEARKALGLSSGDRLVLFIGDPARTEKRHWLAEATLRHLPEDMPAQLITAHNVPHEQMPLYMNACDVLLVTSSTEGSPNAVKEALACNLPIVSTDVGDIRVRISGIDGCYIGENDSPDAMASCLLQVFSRSTRIVGREAVLEYDESCLVERILKIYQGNLKHEN
jgi:glycosyltransferase involved in cell wall biosynthesis